MIRFFFILAFVLGSAQAANATICTIPTTLVNGNIVDAAQLNGNFTSLQSCGNAVDSTNMGSGGIYASQIKPATVGQATFGGAIVYAFPDGLNVNGAVLQANSGLTVVGTTNLAATTFSVAPTMSGANITAGTIPNSALATTPGTIAYNFNGTTLAGTHHSFGTATFSATASATISFVGAAAFTGGNTYSCNATGFNLNNSFYFNQSGGTQTIINTTNTNSVTGSAIVDCFGY